MSEPNDLAEALDSLGSIRWSGVAYRHTTGDRNPLEGFGARLFGGRWNPKDLVSTIYLASPLECCIAEFRRRAGGQARGTDSMSRRSVVHEIECAELDLVDLSGTGLGAVGLTQHDVLSDDWTRCQAVGEAAHFLGLQGLIAPSATGRGIVLAIFEPRMKPNQLTARSAEPMAPLLEQFPA